MALAKKGNWGGIWKSIKRIDKDSNGYVTLEELDEIFREQFPLELEGKSLLRFFRIRYGSIANKNLVNYKQLKQDINSKIAISSSVTPSERTYPSEISSYQVTATDLKRKQPLQKMEVDDEDDLSTLKIEGTVLEHGASSKNKR